MSRKSLAPRLAATVFVAAQLLGGVAFACKDRMYPQQFPLKELAIYEHAYVIRVEKIDWEVAPDGSWYAPPFAFQGRIERSLKGPLHRGDPIGVASDDKLFKGYVNAITGAGSATGVR